MHQHEELRDIPIVLLANKQDLPVSPSQRIVADHECASLECSPLTFGLRALSQGAATSEELSQKFNPQKLPPSTFRVQLASCITWCVIDPLDSFLLARVPTFHTLTRSGAMKR